MRLWPASHVARVRHLDINFDVRRGSERPERIPEREDMYRAIFELLQDKNCFPSLQTLRLWILTDSLYVSHFDPVEPLTQAEAESWMRPWIQLAARRRDHVAVEVCVGMSWQLEFDRVLTETNGTQCTWDDLGLKLVDGPEYGPHIDTFF